MADGRYIMSFSTGSLFHRESVILAELYLDLGDWHSVRDKVISENVLQARTLKTLRLVCGEILSRLRTMNPSELEFLVAGSRQEQSYLLWLAVCRRYQFIADFAVEVLRERFITLKHDLTLDDYDSFFNRKSEWHMELDAITQSTRGKLRQVLFRMLRETDFLTTSNLIHAAILGPKLLELIRQHDRRELMYFPLFESDVKGMKL